MQDLPPGWVAVLVAVVTAVQAGLTTWLAERNTREHDLLREELRIEREERRSADKSK